MNDGAVQPSSPPQPPASALPARKSSFASLAFVALGALVMVDVAAETLIAGSAVRWWAVGAAAVYLALAILVLRKSAGWLTQLTLLLVFLPGLAATSAWLPGGLSNGIYFAGQPTSRVLAAFTAIALIVAVMTTMRAALLPLAARLGITLLLLYGLVAFFLGGWQGAPFPTLFTGDTVFHTLPRWLAGTILGGLLALPLALLIGIVHAVGRRSWPQLLRPVLVLAAGTAIVFAAFMSSLVATPVEQQGGLSAPGTVAAPVRFAPPDTSSLSDAEAVLQRLDDDSTSSRFSAERAADQAGTTPAALFNWVHDHIRLEIYSGALRGARGTLISGAGNAWDQALLMAAMLRHQGRDVRFAKVHLSPEIATTIVGRMFADASKPLPYKPVETSGALQNGGRDTLKRIQGDWQRINDDLQQALQRGNIPLGDSAVSETLLESEAADHVFVEYRDGDQWIALDPVAMSAPGAAVALPAQHAGDMPDSFYHHVTVRIVIEERHGQNLQQQPVFELTTTAAALSGAKVVLAHKLTNDISGGWRAIPVLQIDSQAYAARAFSDSGLVAGKGSGPGDLIAQAHNAVTHLDSVTAAFGDDKPAAAAQPAAPQSAFTGEWLEVEFADPAKHTEVVRRELIDRIGPVARANKTAPTAPLAPLKLANGFPLSLEGVYALAFVTGTVDPSLPASRLASAKGLNADLQALRDAHPVQNGTLSAQDQERLGRVLEQYPALLQSSVESTLALSQRFARSKSIGSSALFYEATPRLAIAGFDLTSGLTLDLRRNAVRVLSGKSPPQESVRANLARSVADAAIEGDVLKISARSLAAIDVFDRARAQGISLAALRGGASLSSLQIGDMARARMSSAGASALVAPQRTPSGDAHFAWWQLDPSTGDAVSTLDTGLNGFQDLPEEAVIETNVISPMAQTMSGPFNPISPMAQTMNLGTQFTELPVQLAGQGHPWAMCVEFSEEMILELLRALTAVGEDTSAL